MSERKRKKKDGKEIIVRIKRSNTERWKAGRRKKEREERNHMKKGREGERQGVEKMARNRKEREIGKK